MAEEEICLQAGLSADGEEVTLVFPDSAGCYILTLDREGVEQYLTIFREIRVWMTQAAPALPDEDQQTIKPDQAAIRMIREAIEELFGPVASLESEGAVLLRSYPEAPASDAEAIVAALQRVADHLNEGKHAASS